MKKIIIFMTLIMLVLLACKKSQNNPIPVYPNQTFSATLNGVNYSANSGLTADYFPYGANYQLLIFAHNTNDKTYVEINIESSVPLTTGTYSAVMQYNPPPNGTNWVIFQGTVPVTITALEPGNLKGTFRGVLSNNQPPGTETFTNGTFSINNITYTN